MTIALSIIVTLATFLAMEGITWLTHRYVMHGPLWVLHRDHHQPRPGIFEKNDLFFVIFAIPSILLILHGTLSSAWWSLSIGIGIMLYGMAYFIVHDVIIHQRLKWFRNSRSTYVRAIRWAHKMHHKHLERENGESFGMLLVHRRYWQKVKRDQALMSGKAQAHAGSDR